MPLPLRPRPSASFLKGEENLSTLSSRQTMVSAGCRLAPLPDVSDSVPSPAAWLLRHLVGEGNQLTGLIHYGPVASEVGRGVQPLGINSAILSAWVILWTRVADDSSSGAEAFLNRVDVQAARSTAKLGR